jgi:hypothetical protein
MTAPDHLTQAGIETGIEIPHHPHGRAWTSADVQALRDQRWTTRQPAIQHEYRFDQVDWDRPGLAHILGVRCEQCQRHLPTIRHGEPLICDECAESRARALRPASMFDAFPFDAHGNLNIGPRWHDHINDDTPSQFGS